MNKNLLKAYDSDQFRDNGHKLVDLLADYMHDCLNSPAFPVLPWKDPADQEEYWKEFFYSDNPPDIAGFYSDFLEKSIHIHHPRYAGHQVVPPVPLAALTAMLEAFTNNGMAIYEMGPAATAMEKVVIDWLNGIIGWEEQANGLMTSGGSIGNLTALLTARQAFAGRDSWEEGVNDKMGVLVSTEAHYSVERAIKIMGLGEKGLVKVPVDEQYRIKTTLLPGILEDCRSKGIQVFALIGNACSTSTGKYDDLIALGDFCQENHIWFHVDAAHGGPAMFSEKYRHLVAGLEKANSIVIDFHKMMLTPALTTAVLFRDGKTSFEAFAQKAQYLLSKKGNINWWDGAGRTLECTKKPMAVKVYLLVKTFGAALFEAYIEHTYGLAREFAEMILSRPGFELAVMPDSNIVCFRCVPGYSDPAALNALNEDIRKSLKESGRFYIVQTRIDGRVFLRVSLMNPFTKPEDLIDLLAEIEARMA